ncbi:MFS general substrate transporter [Polychaeton citri CBS 116435]|uniref:MFS general substrate transporter n=1 Tax=Polychaeton citri CBS 116435 TaxID=1314669 RepID=A0A9P4Q5B9_9PEZI|nr:MFS general substrate transporter [Polychaeton citri CBS 116435]
MSLAQRRGSMESFDHLHRSSTSGDSQSERRKLSFNPVGEWVGPIPHEENLGAFEISKTKRVVQVVSAIIYCLFGAGVVFGFAAIKPVLIAEGVYRDKCTKEELDAGVWTCYGQELRLNLMFTVAAVSTNVCALPVGTVLDRFGPKVASLLGVVFLTLGALFMAFAKDLTGTFDAYIPGYLFLALGGPFVFISSFQLSNTFPAHSGLILALLTGAFDTSSAVFLVYRLIYEGTDGSFTTKKFFLIYLIVPVYVLLAQLFVMPVQSYKTVGELVKQIETEEEGQDATYPNGASNGSPDDETRALLTNRRESVASQVTSLLGSKAGGVEQQEAEAAKASKSGVWGALHGRTARQQILTLWFALITLFTVVQMLRINYFVATIRTQYATLLHSYPLAVRVNQVFDVALPLGGVVAVPFIGLILDHTSTPFVLGLLVALATAIGVLGVIPAEGAAYANIALFVVYRPLYYTAVSDYAAKVFGFATFGKVYGLIICLAGVFNFAQAALDALTHGAFRDDPVPVNIILLCTALVVGTALVAFVWRKSYTMEREKVEEEAEAASEVLMPGAREEEVDRPHGHQGYGTA